MSENKNDYPLLLSYTLVKYSSCRKGEKQRIVYTFVIQARKVRKFYFFLFFFFLCNLVCFNHRCFDLSVSPRRKHVLNYELCFVHFLLDGILRHCESFLFRDIFRGAISVPFAGRIEKRFSCFRP